MMRYCAIVKYYERCYKIQICKDRDNMDTHTVFIIGGCRL